MLGMVGLNETRHDGTWQQTLHPSCISHQRIDFSGQAEGFLDFRIELPGVEAKSEHMKE